MLAALRLRALTPTPSFRRDKRDPASFTADTRGATSMIFALVLVPVVFLLGTSVDYGRAVTARTRLQSAADAAALATLNAPGLTEAERIALAETVFTANVSSDGLLANVTPTVTFPNGTTNVAAGQDVPTSFLKIAGINSLRVDVTSAAVDSNSSSTRQIEVAMMIDLTGSMGQTRNGATKIQGLQEASADLLNILFPGGATTSSTTRVAIAPMADFVNAGSHAAEVTGLTSSGAYNKLGNLTASKSGTYGNLTYSGAGGGGAGQGFSATSSGGTYSSSHCSAGSQYQVVQGYTVGTGSANGTAYGVYASYWKTVGNTMYYVLYSGHYNPVYAATCTPTLDQTGSLVTCVTERTGTDTYTDALPATGSYIGAYNQGRSTSVQNYSADGKCWVAGRELPAIIPLTNDKATLTSFFSNATIGGGTPGHLGHAWAWYMLSPTWASIWPQASEPAAYGTANLLKAAVIMTDGEYNEQYSSATSKDQALALCVAMKAKGIAVYTIGFGFSATAATGSTEANAKNLLTQCSSGANHYFFPYDSAALKAAFQTIGAAIMTSGPPKVRVSG